MQDNQTQSINTKEDDKYRAPEAPINIQGIQFTEEQYEKLTERINTVPRK